MSEVRNAKIAHWEAATIAGRMPQNVPSVLDRPGKITCTDGEITVGGITYECDNVDLHSFLSIADMSQSVNFEYTGDLWGWKSGDDVEITILCLNNAVAFIDNTNPSSPVHIATMMSVNSASSHWCDVKVHRDTAYVVKDSASQQGIQVFDMNRLATEGSYSGNPPNLEADILYDEHGD